MVRLRRVDSGGGGGAGWGGGGVEERWKPFHWVFRVTSFRHLFLLSLVFVADS